MSPLSEVDPEVAAVLQQELDRQRHTLEMIASENFVSKAILETQGSVLTNKYAEGYPGKRYYGGCEAVDIVEELARERAKELFGAEHANVQPHSGATANAAVMMALANPGDRILGLSLAHGGHLTHGMKLNFSGRMYEAHSYELDPETHLIDMETVRQRALEVKPAVLIAGWSAYSRHLDFAAFRAIADEVGALLMFDIAHIAGLVAGGAHPNPVPYADVVTFTTHKTLRGPRGGCILTTAAHAAAIDKAVFPGSQGGPLQHAVAAKAVAFHEALQPSFKDYAQQIVKNASALAEALSKQGFRLVSGGTDTHMMVVDLQPFDAELTGKESQLVLDEAGITLNKNNIPNDPRSPFVTSGVRIGTPSVTTQGMKEPEMALIAEYIATTLRNRANPSAVAEVRAKVAALCAKFPVYAKRA